MKNVTITLPEEVARWARIRAATQDMSLSRMVAGMLERRMVEEERYQSAGRAFLGRKPLILKSGGSYPSRDDLHERELLR